MVSSYIEFVFVVFALTFLILLKVYVILTKGKCYSKRKLNGMTALVTGSNRGIGYVTALNLAKRGARVIITSENQQALLQAQKRMVLASGNRDIIAKKLDFLSLSEVREFAKVIIETEKRLDILVNNAGTVGLGKDKTKDGLLPGMQVNYFGPFLLTNLLLGLMKQTPNSRIVNLASVTANVTFAFDVNDINKVDMPIFFEPFVYCNSKICMAHFSIELAKKLKGTGVTVNCLHPGAVYTELYKKSKINLVIYAKIIDSFLFKTTEEGAETTIHLAACERAEGITGKYFSDCRPSRLWADLSAEARAKVWEQSVQLVGLKSEEMFL